MNRHYYISDNIDELEVLEHELEDEGLARTQIHVLSQSDRQLKEHDLPEVEAVLKTDVVHGTEIGALIGLALAIIVLVFAYVLGVAESTTWVPFIFLSLLALGFCTWEGGLFGIQMPNTDFRAFREVLAAGKHVLFVDVEKTQEPVLQGVINAHPQLQLAGDGGARPRWVIDAYNKWLGFIRVMP